MWTSGLLKLAIATTIRKVESLEKAERPEATGDCRRLYNTYIHTQSEHSNSKHNLTNCTIINQRRNLHSNRFRKRVRIIGRAITTQEVHSKRTSKWKKKDAPKHSERLWLWLSLCKSSKQSLQSACSSLTLAAISESQWTEAKNRTEYNGQVSYDHVT